MIYTTSAARGMVVAPHHLAAQAGVSVLREGGNAIEAMVAAAATIAVVYPHMNSIGGDGFWLIHEPGTEPVAIDACGAAGQNVSIELYERQGLSAIPSRGPLAANTVAGTVAGWKAALDVATRWGGTMALERLLDDAIYYGEHGIPVTASQHENTTAKHAELVNVHGFVDAFAPGSKPPVIGARFKQPRLAQTLARLRKAGLDDFYRGELAKNIAADLARAGSPLTADDLSAHHSRTVTPLSLKLAQGTAYNFPPPTQGLASLLILGIFERLSASEADSFEHIHGLVEATKQAFMVRDRVITDPAYMDRSPDSYLQMDGIAAMAANIDGRRALPWPQPAGKGDTIWMGAIDGEGRAVSFIQSIYWEFGSGVVLDETGIQWQNRGSSFQLSPGARNALVPGRKPFHTLNPALCRFDDGRVMSYGTMGGEGQPQTQAAVFTRHATYGQSLQQAVTAPRWLLGRTWGAETTTLKLESRFPAALVERLRAVGHDIELVGDFDSVMGHAGALVRYPNGVIEAAADPRSDGRAAGF